MYHNHIKKQLLLSIFNCAIASTQMLYPISQHKFYSSYQKLKFKLTYSYTRQNLHWFSKTVQKYENDPHLPTSTIGILPEMQVTYVFWHGVNDEPSIRCTYKRTTYLAIIGDCIYTTNNLVFRFKIGGKTKQSDCKTKTLNILFSNCVPYRKLT